MDLKNLDNRVRKQFDDAVISLKQVNPMLAEQLSKCKYSIYYTNPINSLKPGNIYFLGLNPGGTPKDEHGFKILDSSTFHRDDECAFIDDKWIHRGCEFPEGQAPHQKRVRELLTFLLKELHEQPDIRKVFATNLYFFRSVDKEMLINYGIKNCDCWNYHEEFLNIVKPKIVVCNGNDDKISAFSSFKKHFSTTDTEPVQWYRGFSLKGFFIDKPFWKPDGKTLVLGIPHMSWYDPHNKRVMSNGENLMFQKIRELCSQIDKIGN